MTNTNDRIAATNIVSLPSNNEESWEIAKDVVDYPVNIVEAFFKEDDEFVSASGQTNTGRDTAFYFVVVDKLRVGQFNPIACVTGMYGTVKTADVYEDLKLQLEQLGEDYELRNLYVSGDGGAQALTVSMKNMIGMEGIPDEVNMNIRINTSVDGTKSHSISMMVHNKTGDTSCAVYGGEHRLAARHTTTIDARTVDFVPEITNMVKNWNENIIPMMMLMFDCKYDKAFAEELVEQLAEESGFGKRHRAKIRSLYKTDQVRTNDSSDSLYRVNATIAQYIEDELGEKNELQERFRNGLAKAVNKQLNKKK